ncbi:MAG: lysophospholipid acyltransferase family protein [Dehalococcoidia bacterium]
MHTGAARVSQWPRRWWVRWIRRGLMSGWYLPTLHMFYSVDVTGREHLKEIEHPALIVSNHNMHLDQSMLLWALPHRFRQKVTIAAAEKDIFGNRVRGFISALLGNAFPFAKEGAGIRESLGHVVGMLEDGWHVLLFPEGKLTVDGPMQPFKPGVGLLARETGAQVLPMRIDLLRPGFLEGRWWPNPRARVKVSIGRPISIPPRTGHAEATAMLERAVREA